MTRKSQHVKVVTRLSSTATQFFGSASSLFAASKYTLGSGLNRGGSKSLSPL